MDIELITKLLGPTPSVGGMIPKILASIPKIDQGAEWDGKFASAGTREVNGQPYIDVLIKVEPREYEGVVALESLCLQLHKSLEFRVPDHWKTEIDGMRLLAVARFDRQQNRSIPMESFFSIFAGASTTFSENSDTDWEDVATRLKKLAELVKMDVVAVQRDLFRRILLAFCTGNGDMHLENVSLLGGSGGVSLAPVYDPAPMRAWPQHDTRSAVPINMVEGQSYVESMTNMGVAFGYTKREAWALLEEMLNATREYPAMIRALDWVPADRRERLSRIIESERKEIENTLKQ
jgi:serine/threonine-protein kinase HipA